MAKLFYDHLIIIEEVISVLDSYNLSSIEREQILDLIDQTMQQEILATVLSNIPKQHHELFLSYLHVAPQDKKIIEFVREKGGDNIEKQILKTANRVKKKILKEIRSAGKRQIT